MQQFAEEFMQRRYGFAHDLVQRGCGIGQLARHDPAGQRAVGFIQQHQHEIADKQAQPHLGCAASFDICELHGLERCEIQGFGEQAILAAEVVIHRCDIRFGAAADFAHRRSLEAMLREHFARRIQQPRAGLFGRGSGFMHHLPASFAALSCPASAL